MIEHIKLDVCCGNGKQEGYVGIDKRDISGVDIVHDICVFPWPLEDDSCVAMCMNLSWAIIEPKYRIDVMNEMWRILQLDGILEIRDPYYKAPSAIHDPAVYNNPNETTFKYFDPVYPKYITYEPKPWRLIRYGYCVDKLLIVEMTPRKTQEGREL